MRVFSQAHGSSPLGTGVRPGEAPAGFPGAGGFTFVELLTVLAIIAILSAIVLGAGRRAVESSRIARAKAELATLGAALESYRRQYGDYPPTNEAALMLQALIGQRGPDLARVAGRSRLDLALFKTAEARDPRTDASAVLIDPWRQPYRYVYRQPAAGWANPSFVLYSIGPDGVDQPDLAPGGFAATGAAANLDNLYAQ